MGVVGLLMTFACILSINVTASMRQRRRYGNQIRYDKLPIIDAYPACGFNCTQLNLKACRIDDCEEILADEEYVSEPPDILRKKLAFIKYTDLQSSELKLALSVQFSPSDDSSIKYTTGYLVHIYDGQTSYKRCYRFKDMDFSNRKDVFKDTCFRPTQQNLTLYSSIYISVSSLPLSLSNPAETVKTFIVTFPPGNDAISWGEVVIDCQKRSLQYSYAAGPEYGARASVSVCEEDGNWRCKIGTKTIVMSDLNLTGTLHDLKIERGHERHLIILSGSDHKQPLNITRVDFSNCPTPIQASLLALVVGGALVFVCLVLVIAACLCARHRAKGSEKEHVLIPSEDRIEASDGGSQETNVADPSVPARKIFVFSKNGRDDDVVDSLCTYLQSCFGQQVSWSAWDREFLGNQWAYVVENIKESDKVVIICSAESRNCDLLDEDIYLRALKLIRDQASMIRNTSKFLICYFTPDSPDCIPEDLSALKRHSHKLMDGFETFFFHVIDVEKYQGGQILTFPEQLDPANPDRQKLEDAIARRTAERLGRGSLLQSTSSSPSSTPESRGRLVASRPDHMDDPAGSQQVETTAEVHRDL